MEDTLPSSGSGMISEVDVGGGSRKFRRCFIGVSHSKAFSRNAIRSVTSLRQSRIANGAAGQVTFFLLKIIALEMVRRFSKSRCPFAWRGLQALQVLCYPPFKWIQRWAPFSCLVKGMQVCAVNFLIYYDHHVVILMHRPSYYLLKCSLVCYVRTKEVNLCLEEAASVSNKHSYIFKFSAYSGPHIIFCVYLYVQCVY